MTCGFALFSVASLGCGFSPSIAVLIFFRILQGLGSGMIFATGTAILVSVYPPRERGRVLGITVSAVYIGLFCGPFLGGALTHHLTWRSLFFVNSILGALVLALVRWRIKGEWAEAKGERLDVTGGMIYGAALVALIYGLSCLPSAKGIELSLAGLAGLAAFAAWEKRTAHPLFDLTLFTSNRTFACSNLAAMIHYSATFAVTFLISLYLQYIRGLDAQMTGFILISQPATMAFFSPLTGKLSDRVEPRVLATFGMMIMFVMLILLSFIEAETSLAIIVASLLVLGFGYAFFSSPNMNAIMGSVERRHLGIAAGSAGTMRVLGQMLSMAIATLVLSRFVGREQITESLHPELLHSFKVILVSFAVLSVAGIAASSVRGKVRD